MAKALKEIIVCYFLPSKDFPLVLFSQSATPCNDPFIESNTSSQRLCFACNHVSFSHMIPLIPSTSTASQSLHVEAEKLIFVCFPLGLLLGAFMIMDNCASWCRLSWTSWLLQPCTDVGLGKVMIRWIYSSAWLLFVSSQACGDHSSLPVLPLPSHPLDTADTVSSPPAYNLTCISNYPLPLGWTWLGVSLVQYEFLDCHLWWRMSVKSVLMVKQTTS